MSLRASLPDALQVKPLKSIDTMNIETSILDPVTINKNRCRFVLERKGILDVGSCVQLGVVATTDPNGKAFFPIHTGINSLIRSATLRIGTRAIATTDEFAQYATLWRSMKTVEERNRKDFYTKGTLDGIEPENDETKGRFQPKMVDWPVRTANPLLGTILSAIKPTNDESTTPVFTIKLSELFPHLMKGLQLPLYLIHEPVSIELQFNTQENNTNEVGVICALSEGTESMGITVAQSETKFLADYLTYSDSRMEETARLTMTDSGLVIPYDDVILTSYSIPAVTDPGENNTVSQSINRELGFCGKKVKHLLWADTPVHKSGNGNALLGEYCSVAYKRPDTYNIRVNDLNIYNRLVEREPYKQSQLALVTGVDINVGMPEYSWNGMVDAEYKFVNSLFSADGLVEAHNVNKLQASSHYYGVPLITDPILNEGEMIGQKPILVERTLYRSNDATVSLVAALTNLTWGCYERTMVLRNGSVSVSA